jgi:hypothetical protein
MSALCQKRTHAAQQRRSLFDHRVGDGEQLVRNCEAESPCRRQVDDEIELRRLLNGDDRQPSRSRRVTRARACQVQTVASSPGIAHRTFLEAVR